MPPIQKVLIANRGEIALRIIRACKELGLKTVSIHSTADKNSLHVRFADESICVGPAPVRESYLNVHMLMCAASLSGADAVHPGYGFLSENAEFAETCRSHGLTWIGPHPSCISAMGNKVTARYTAKAAGVPLVPGSNGPVSELAEMKAVAEEIGYPVLLKAASGGGGRGMKRVDHEDELEHAYNVASSEASAAFGDGSMYLEKFVVNPRHIEIQILADEHGNVVHLGERECSIQRRHQKLLEEAPSSFVTPELRAEMGAAAVRAARKVGYSSAGTVEFIVDADRNFYFIEMNTRIQVEHPVTEAVTGVDLVKEQLRIAMGEPLSVTQDDIKLTGHSIECRINAEDPVSFVPSPGRITGYHEPGGLGVRVDSWVHDQAMVHPWYDSMIAKLIVHAATREEAIARLSWALDEFVVEGIKTTIPLHQRLLTEPRYRSGDVHTGFLAEIGY